MKIKYISSVLLCFSFIVNIGAQCIDDSHSAFKNQGWLSCDSSQSPNIERGNSHWLMYDLGHEYVIDSLTIWNHNVWGETGSGAKIISIDVSVDKTSWTNFGTHTVNKAPGSWKYKTDNLIQLNHAVGQYFLITVLENWDNTSSCRGIAEVRFGVGISTATEDVLTENNWSVYPNPTVDNLTIDLKDRTDIENISIVNALGQIISSINNPSTGQNTISVTDFQEGVYYIRISNNDQIQDKSFVKVNNR
ncbi:T9SS type A sorting domain-containing protein [bacterium]|nr:T9SS type A sorting domain-containing protein [bacterium]